MKTPLQRIRLGAIVLGAMFVVAVVGFRFVGEDYGWIDALWMAVITISTVGYSETSNSSPALQLFSIAVILLGISAAAYTFSGFFQLVLQGELEHAIGARRMTREIDKLADHVVLCGFGRIGRMLAGELQSRQQSVVVLEQDAAASNEAVSHGFLCLEGDATEEEVLVSAHIEKARTLVSALPNDAANVFITLTARNLNPPLQIIARAEHESSAKKLRQAGANRVVMPALIGARQMARMITRPSTADLMERVAESSFTGLELDEFVVSADSSLVGVTVKDTEAHRAHQLLVIAIQPPGGEFVFNPDAEYAFKPDDTVILLGPSQHIESFSKRYAV